MNLPFLKNLINIDIYKWFIKILTYSMITFVLPIIMPLILYISGLYFLIYRYRKPLNLSQITETSEIYRYWERVRQTVCKFWELYATIWYGYEVIGFEHIPNEGPALIIFFHGGLPIDIYILGAKIVLYKNRLIRTVGDHFLFRIPGWKLVMEVYGIFPGSKDNCLDELKRGNLVALSPGGVREAQFGDESYQLMWSQRIGFAKLAIEAQVPIIPVFTQNIREAFRTSKIGRILVRSIYEKFKIPLNPIYGGFPVKLRTFVGKPIEFDPTLSAEDLAKKTSLVIEDMIRKHQRIPGSVTKALMDRFYSYPKDKHI